MIKKFWKFISNIGIKPEYDLKEVKRFTLINQYLSIAVLIFLINSFSDFFYSYYTEAFILLASALLFSFTIILQKHHNRYFIMGLFIYISFTIFYFGTMASVQAGDYLYYFPLVLAISFTFDYKKDKSLMIFLFCFITALLLIYVFTYRTSEEINMVSETVRYKMFVINLVVSAATVGFFIYLTIEDNRVNNLLFEQRLKEKEESEALVKKTLAEKEILLAELHHRVKNNLAVIVGYFNLKFNSTDNEEARTILLESKNHVNSMALIHNRLYKTGNFSEINFATYLKDLLVEIQESYPSLVNSVIVKTRIEDVKLNLNLAIPCALILNEVLNNCYKHAFKTTKKGNIHVDLVIIKDTELMLTVKDNGSGLKEDFDKHDSLGISVIQGLSEQLGGEAKFYNEGGACFSLVFNKA
jgi:two-component sensor histidine kinase